VIVAKTNGWVKLHRKILVTELPASQFKFFVGAILLAKSPKSKDSGLVDLSVRQLADELHMSRSEVWRREKELEKMEMISLLDKGFIINNYDYYQTGKGVPPTGHKTDKKPATTVSPTGQEKENSVPPEGQSVPPTGRSVPPEGQSVPSRETESAHKKVKTIKNIEKKASPERKRLEFEDYIEELRPQFSDLDYELELRKFKLYWSEGSRKLQRPKLALLNWMTKAREYKKEKGGKSGTHQQGSRRLPKVYRPPEVIWPPGKDD